jgi:hypothetical protein
MNIHIQRAIAALLTVMLLLTPTSGCSQSLIEVEQPVDAYMSATETMPEPAVPAIEHVDEPTSSPRLIDDMMLIMDLNLSCADEAEMFLRKMFEDDITITRTPDKDRWEGEDEFRHFRYAFTANYSITGIPSANDTIYIFVRKGERRGSGLGIHFEEMYPYSLLADVLFPVPIYDGEPIPYYAHPLFDAFYVSYGFEDWILMPIYEAQLREAGFAHHGSMSDMNSGFRSDSYWTFDDIDHNRRYVVSFDMGEGFAIIMSFGFIAG